MRTLFDAGADGAVCSVISSDAPPVVEFNNPMTCAAERTKRVSELLETALFAADEKPIEPVDGIAKSAGPRRQFVVAAAFCATSIPK
jgi:hypothetical protein